MRLVGSKLPARPCIHYPMAYDLSKLKAPHLTGTSLRLFTAVLETNFPGKLIIKKLMADSGIPYLTNIFIEENPTYFPIHSHPETKSTTTKLKKQIKKNEQFGMTIDNYAASYRSGKITPVDIAENIIKLTVDNKNGDPLNAVLKLDKDDLKKQAEESLERFRQGKPLSILDGVPIAIKDEINAIPYSTSVGTSFLGEKPTTEDAEVVRRLREAGALIFCKTNMHEIGIGVTGVNPHFRHVKNPYDPVCYSGGSSSGSAAVVASGLCPVAIGADGGGSIRIPAAFCGVTGLKPTFGRVSERGAAPLCWSVAHIGPIAGTARDTAILYEIIAGKDPKEFLTQMQPEPELANAFPKDLKGLIFGIYPDWFYDCDKSMHTALNNALDYLKSAGAEIIEIEIPELEEMRIAQLITIVSEMTTAMSPYDKEHRKDFGLDVRTNLAIGRSFTNVEYIHAQRMRTRAVNIFEKTLTSVNAILTPSTGICAPEIPIKALPKGESNLPMLSDIMRFVTPSNLTGHPAISIPIGYDPKGMPIGLQAIGRPWEESLLLGIAGILEQMYEKRKPEVYLSPVSEIWKQ
jgi:Asp-tRNA(Asn)/Glu-tRNA(Gln) amidotransferase A subunit family amidase